MIGRLTGRLAYLGGDHVMIDVGGVGYLVHVSERTLMAMPGQGEPVSLYTDMLVREDLMQLFGFTSLLEKEWYRLLISVQGVGSKASMAILGAIGAEGVGRAIALGDSTAIKAAPGVGPKIAQRVINELKDKAPTVMALGGSLEVELGEPPVETIETPLPGRAPTSTTTQPTGAAHQASALSALLNLGYGQGEAASAVATAARDAPEAGEADLIRAALKLLAPKG